MNNPLMAEMAPELVHNGPVDRSVFTVVHFNEPRIRGIQIEQELKSKSSEIRTVEIATIISVQMISFSCGSAANLSVLPKTVSPSEER